MSVAGSREACDRLGSSRRGAKDSVSGQGKKEERKRTFHVEPEEADVKKEKAGKGSCHGWV